MLASGADLGIMLDTDVDRSGVVDREGNGGCLEGGEGWVGEGGSRFWEAEVA